MIRVLGVVTLLIHFPKLLSFFDPGASRSMTREITGTGA